jgi:hypothetical protein
VGVVGGRSVLLKVTEQKKAAFKDRKGPDFISRLRGYVDVRGIDKKAPDDDVYVVRRAILLRSILERDFRSFLRDKKADIDPTVLRALVVVPEYTHGTRSMEAVLHMSRLARAKRFSAAMLPPIDRLNMHVKDVGQFRKLLKGN